MYYSDDCNSGKTAVNGEIMVFDWDVVPSIVLLLREPRCVGEVLLTVEVERYY